MTTANKFYSVLDEFGIDEALGMGVNWYPRCLEVLS
jgi:hypothetical protein